MKAKLLSLLSSFTTSLLLMLVYAAALAVATFVEKYYGTATARNWVYHSPLLYTLQAAMAVNFTCAAFRHGYFTRAKWGILLCHLSLVTIMGGALITHLFGEEGTLYLREGQTSDRIKIGNGETATYKSLPFSVRLNDFRMEHYPGSGSPSSYESHVTVITGGKNHEACISMNKVLDVQGYRFFQASFSPDEQGSVLSVNHDVAGRTVTYTGYALLFLGLWAALFGKHSRFTTRWRQLRNLGRNTAVTVAILMLATVPQAALAQDAESAKEIVALRVVSKEHARRFGCLTLQEQNGRMMPVNTFSSEVLRKLHKDNEVFGLSPDRFLISLLALPDVWSYVLFIPQENKELNERYGLSMPYCSYAEAFNENGDYKLQVPIEAAFNKMPQARSRFDKDVLKLNEQFNLFNQLINGQRLAIFPLEGHTGNKWFSPGDSLADFTGKDSLLVAKIFDWYLDEVRESLQSGDWSKADNVVQMIATYQEAKGGNTNLSKEKLEAELKYNNLRIFPLCRIGYLAGGALLLLLAMADLFRSNRWAKATEWVLCTGIAATFAFHTYGIALRGHIAGYAPWSNSYETMVYVAWTMLLGGFLFIRRSRITFALASLFAGITLFVSGLNWMDPQITPLVPVLQSPWLMFHVAVIVAAYGFFGINFLLGITNMTLICLHKDSGKRNLKQDITRLTIVSELALWIGLALMTTGTFLGAVWANESWGRYWGWDPKETWALVTMMVYAIVAHLHLSRRTSGIWLFNAASTLAFTSVVMTFFGVNYFLSGMHSYGMNEGLDHFFTIVYSATAAVIMLIAISYFGKRKIF